MGKPELTAAEQAAHTFKLTDRIVSPGDLRRVRRELELLDAALRHAAVRTGGQANTLPRASRLLETLAGEAGANLLDASDRQELLDYANRLLETAPSVHISFAGEPSAKFLQQVVGWMRSNIHPQLLLSVGLQPSIVAGCVVRTTNRQFDFSLAAAFDTQRTLLVDSLRPARPAGGRP